MGFTQFWVRGIIFLYNIVLNLFEAIWYLEIFVFSNFLVQEGYQLFLLRVCGACFIEISLIKSEILFSINISDPGDKSFRKLCSCHEFVVFVQVSMDVKVLVSML